MITHLVHRLLRHRATPTITLAERLRVWDGAGSGLAAGRGGFSQPIGIFPPSRPGA